MFSYKDLGLDLMPKTDVPVVNVFVQLPGASAEEIETQITKRIEEAVNTISGIDELRANSDVGRAQISINFTLERDIEAATQDVRDKIATIVNQFPRDAKPPVIQKVDPDSQPILVFSVYGPRDQKEITEIVDKKVKQDLETLEGVGSITFQGERKREIQLLLNADRLNAYGLSVDEVRNAVVRQNVEIPGGSFVSGRRKSPSERWAASRTSKTSTASCSRTGATGRSSPSATSAASRTACRKLRARTGPTASRPLA